MPHLVQAQKHHMSWAVLRYTAGRKQRPRTAKNACREKSDRDADQPMTDGNDEVIALKNWE